MSAERRGHLGEKQDFQFLGEVLQVLRVAMGLREWHSASGTADLGSGAGESRAGGQWGKPITFSQKPTFLPKY